MWRIVDLSKAMALPVKKKRQLKTILRLMNLCDKPRSDYTRHEIESMNQAYLFITQGILRTS